MKKQLLNFNIKFYFFWKLSTSELPGDRALYDHTCSEPGYLTRYNNGQRVEHPGFDAQQG
jgi:hypothetical protein